MALKRKIVAIGGGSMVLGETLRIDEEIIRLSGKKKPRVLFIPTASSDDMIYSDNFKKVYGGRYGCAVEVLFLLRKKHSPTALEKIISAADIIYVGGGNTLKMMRRWRFLGVDKMLLKAWKKGTVCCGTSAGALCWFARGHSDSMAYYHPKKWKWIRVKGLGLVDTLLCPHYLKEKRDEDFRKMVKTYGGTGIAVDDSAAFEIIDDTIRVITATDKANGFKVFKNKKKVEQILLPKNGKFIPLAELLAAGYKG